MLTIYKDLDLDIPSDVTIEINSRLVTVKGPRGELQKVRRPLPVGCDADRTRTCATWRWTSAS